MRAFIVEYEVDFGAEGKARFCNGFVIANHYSHSLQAYQEMIAWAVERIPGINLAEIELRTVAESNWCKGCPMIRFPLLAGTTHADFHQTHRLDIREA